MATRDAKRRYQWRKTEQIDRVAPEHTPEYIATAEALASVELFTDFKKTASTLEKAFAADHTAQMRTKEAALERRKQRDEDYRIQAEEDHKYLT